MITRNNLTNTTMRMFMHVDGRDFFQNHYANDAYPRLSCIVEQPRGRRSKIITSKRFFVDGIEVFGCRELLERLNAPAAAAEEGASIERGEDAA
jgi:hypothetical protein